MKNFIEKKAELSDEEVNELLYYYQQGIEVGKEETKMSIVNKLIEYNISINIISKVTDISLKELNQFS